ncbi:MAG: hypothetical protein AB7V13_03970 [Pseudorhodoplanes sp.]|uniref:hypothetical protein n=1 Tax=Pseudorhodoplanes sp. TaxID=1934341 RepID=UPI003D142EA4
MHPDAYHVQKEVISAWERLRVSMQKMYQSTDVRPGAGHDIFKLNARAPDDEVKLDIGPIVFNVPERAGRGHNLYVVVRGWLSFGDGNLRELPLKTRAFFTEVAYFRLKGNVLQHVYGVHYDLDEKLPGHPVFHGQLSSRMDLAPSVRDHYRVEDQPQEMFTPLLRNIRIPTAQMDVFSTVVQICADHLVFEGADQNVHEAFAEARSINSFFQGAAHRMPFLNEMPAIACYRSIHWYTRAPQDSPAAPGK